MSDDLHGLGGPDVSPDAAERIRRRAQAELARQSDPETRTWLGRAEGWWVRRAEPVLVGGFAVAFVVWGLCVSFWA